MWYWLFIGSLVWAYLVMGTILCMLLFFSWDIPRPKRWHYVVTFFLWPVIALVLGLYITGYFFKYVIWSRLRKRS